MQIPSDITLSPEDQQKCNLAGGMGIPHSFIADCNAAVQKAIDKKIQDQKQLEIDDKLAKEKAASDKTVAAINKDAAKFEDISNQLANKKPDYIKYVILGIVVIIVVVLIIKYK